MHGDAYHMIHVINGSLYIQYMTLVINRWHHPFLTLVLKLLFNYSSGTLDLLSLLNILAKLSFTFQRSLASVILSDSCCFIGPMT